MKKTTLLTHFFLLLMTISVKSQTVVWSSDSEDTTGWGTQDLDGDGNNWGIYTGLEAIGFSTGQVFGSASWTNTGALTPDNILFTPTFSIPGSALEIIYKMKVAASFTPDFAEKYAVYVYDEALPITLNNVLIEETLTSGGPGSAKTITLNIPVSFAGKTIGIIIRHFDCTNQDLLLIDDFEVSFSTTLSVENNSLDISGLYPNPFKDVITIKTSEIINTASVINQLGQKVLEITEDEILNNSINLSSLKNGLYFLTVKSKEKMATVKIIKN